MVVIVLAPSVGQPASRTLDDRRLGGGFLALAFAGFLRSRRGFGSGGAAALGLSAFAFSKLGISSSISSASDGSSTTGGADCTDGGAVGAGGGGGNASTSPLSPPRRIQRSMTKCGRWRPPKRVGKNVSLRVTTG